MEEKASDKDKWREKASDKDKWKEITAWTVQQFMNYPRPFIKGGKTEYIASCLVGQFHGQFLLNVCVYSFSLFR